MRSACRTSGARVTDPDLEAIEARIAFVCWPKDAAETAWWARVEDVEWGVDGQGWRIGTGIARGELQDEDAEPLARLIAHAPTDLRALIAEVRALRAERDALRSRLNSIGANHEDDPDT